MATKRMRRARPWSGVPVSRALFHYLTFGNIRDAAALEKPGESRWQLFDGVGPHSHQAAWHAIEAEALIEWTALYPGTRPHSWWEWSASDLRHVWGRFTRTPGRGRCHETGVPYGSPDDFDDLPMIESQAGYLDRHALWLRGERARVLPATFDPQPFGWDLTVSPHVGGMDEHDEA